jgi:hypothetical protein
MHSHRKLGKWWLIREIASYRFIERRKNVKEKMKGQKERGC